MNPIARFLSVAFLLSSSPVAFAVGFDHNPILTEVFADVLSDPTSFTTGLRYEVLTKAPASFPVSANTVAASLPPAQKGTVALTYKLASAGEMPNLSYALSSHFSSVSVPNIVSLRYTVTVDGTPTLYESFYDVTAIADSAFKADQGSGIISISFTAGNSISSIGKDAFRGVNNLNVVDWTHLTNLTHIKPNAFKGCRSLITQSNGDLEKLTKLTTLGDSAFAETILSSVTLAAPALHSLGKHVFADIPTLTAVTLSACHALTPLFLTKDVFGSNLASIVFPNTYIDSIPAAAFRGCTNLTSVTFPYRLMKIGPAAFADCPMLTSLTWPTDRNADAVDTIGTAAFKNTALTTLDFTAGGTGFFPGIKFIEAEAFAAVSAPLTLPSSIKSVGPAAFDAVPSANLSQLPQTPPLPEGINKKMFSPSPSTPSTPSTKLTTITLPTWLTFIEEDAFQGCTNLQTVNWDALISLKEIRKNAFQATAVGKDGTLLSPSGLPALSALESIEESAFHSVAIPVQNTLPLTLPQSVQYLGPDAFANNQGLTSVNLSLNTNLKTTPSDLYHPMQGPDKPPVLLNSAMFGRWLTEISFPSNLSAIPDAAFKNAAALTKVTNWSALNNLLSIGASAFEATSVGTSLTSLPQNLTSIAPRAFYNAAISTTTEDYFTLPASLTSLGDSAFAANPALTKLSLENNNTPPLLTLFENKLINSTPPPLFTYALWFGSAITHFTYPSSQSFTGANAWNGHRKLIELTLPSAPALTINSASFKNAFDPTYTTVTIPPSVTAIDAEAFANNAGLTTLTFEANSALRSIGQKAFYNIPCNSSTLNLTAATTLLTEIGDSAFIFSTNNPTIVNLSSLALTSSVTKKVFGSHLITLHLPTNTATIPADAFKNVTSLTTINFAALTALTSIADSAFAATSIPSLTLPATVTSLGKGAFAKNPRLKTLNLSLATLLPSSSINKETFGTALTSITFPTNLETIPADAFKGLTNLTTTNFSSLNNLLSIGASAFEATQVGPSLTWPTPSKITSIAARAFYNAAISTTAEDASDFTLPTTLTSLGDSAFAANPALTRLSLKNNNTPPLLALFASKLINSTPPPAYGNWFGTNLTHFTYPSSQTFTGTNAWSGYKQLQQLTLPNAASLTINDASFKNAFAPSSPTLASLTIPSKTIAIGNEAFADNAGLKTLTFETNTTLQSIGLEAFKNTGITTLNLSTLPALRSIGPGAFIFNSASPTVVDLSALPHLAPASCTRHVFGSALTQITLHPNLSAIPTDAFSNCPALTSINWADLTKLTSIGNNAFANSPAGITPTDGKKTLNLSKMTLLTAIGSEAFKNTGLTDVILPPSITSIAAEAFLDNHITAVDLSACTALSPNAASLASSQNVWGNKLTTFFFPTHITAIQPDAFANTPLTNTNLTTIYTYDPSKNNSTPPQPPYSLIYNPHDCGPAKAGTCQLTSVGPRAFKNTKLAGDLDLRNLNTAAGLAPAAFYGTQLRAVILPAGLQSIPDSAFANIPTLRWLFNAASSASANPTLAFGNPQELFRGADADNHDGAHDEGIPHFAGLKNDKNLVLTLDSPAFTTLNASGLPPSLTSIGKEAFYATPLRGNLVLPTGYLLSIGDSAFTGPTPGTGPLFTITTKYEIPAVTDKNKGIVSPAKSLSNLQLPAGPSPERSLIYIGAAAFRNALPDLQRLEILGGTDYGDYAFEGANALRTIRGTRDWRYVHSGNLAKIFPKVPENADSTKYRAYLNIEMITPYTDPVAFKAFKDKWKEANGWTAGGAFQILPKNRSDNTDGEMTFQDMATKPIDFRYGVNNYEGETDVWIEFMVLDVEKNIYKQIPDPGNTRATFEFKSQAPVGLTRGGPSRMYVRPYSSGLYETGEAGAELWVEYQEVHDIHILEWNASGFGKNPWAETEPFIMKVRTYLPKITFEGSWSTPPPTISKGSEKPYVTIPFKITSGGQPINAGARQHLELAWEGDHNNSGIKEFLDFKYRNPVDVYKDDPSDPNHYGTFSAIAYPTSDYTLPAITVKLKKLYTNSNNTSWIEDLSAITALKNTSFTLSGPIVTVAPPKTVTLDDLRIDEPDAPPYQLSLSDDKAFDLSFNLKFDGHVPDLNANIVTYNDGTSTSQPIKEALTISYPTGTLSTTELIPSLSSPGGNRIHYTLQPTNKVGVTSVAVALPPFVPDPKNFDHSIAITLDNSGKDPFTDAATGWRYEIIEEPTLHDDGIYGKVALVQGDVTASSAYTEAQTTGSVTLPPSVTRTVTTGSQTVTLNYKLTAIGVMAFRGCSNMTAITLPPSIDSIGRYAFYGCNALAFANLSNLPALRTIREFAFTGTPLTGTLLDDNNQPVIPSPLFIPPLPPPCHSCPPPLSFLRRQEPQFSSLTYIGASAFQKTNLSFVDLQLAPAAAIGPEAFAETPLLDTVILSGDPTAPASLHEPFRLSHLTTLFLSGIDLHHSPFQQLPNLASVTFSGAGSIPPNAFVDCNTLETISFQPNSKYSLEDAAFSGLPALQYLAWPVVPSLISNSPDKKIDAVFNGLPQNCSIYLPWDSLTNTRLQPQLAAWGRPLLPTYSLAIVDPPSHRIELYNGRADTLAFQLLRHGKPILNSQLIAGTDITPANTFDRIAISPLHPNALHAGISFSESQQLNDPAKGGYGRDGLGRFSLVSHAHRTGIDSFVLSLANGPDDLKHIAHAEGFRPDTFAFAVRSPMTQSFAFQPANPDNSEWTFNGTDTLFLYAGEKDFSFKTFISLYGAPPTPASASVITRWDVVSQAAPIPGNFFRLTPDALPGAWTFDALRQGNVTFSVKASINDAVDSTRLTVAILPVDTLVSSLLTAINQTSAAIKTNESVTLTAQLAEYTQVPAGEQPRLINRPFVADSLSWAYDFNIYNARIVSLDGRRQGHILHLTPRIYTPVDSITEVFLRYKSFSGNQPNQPTVSIKLKKPDVILHAEALGFTDHNNPLLDELATNDGTGIVYTLKGTDVFRTIELKAIVKFDQQELDDAIKNKIPGFGDATGTGFIDWKVDEQSPEPVFNFPLRGFNARISSQHEGSASVSFTLKAPHNQWLTPNQSLDLALSFIVAQVPRKFRILHNGLPVTTDRIALTAGQLITLQADVYTQKGDNYLLPQPDLAQHIQWTASSNNLKLISSNQGSITFQAVPTISDVGASETFPTASVSLDPAAGLSVPEASVDFKILPPTIRIVVAHSGATVPIFDATASGQAPAQTLLAQTPYTFSVRIFVAGRELPADSLRVTWTRPPDDLLNILPASEQQLHHITLTPRFTDYDQHQTSLSLSVAGISCDIPITIPATQLDFALSNNGAFSIPLFRSQEDALSVTPKVNGFDIPQELFPPLHWSTIPDQTVIEFSQGSDNTLGSIIKALAPGSTRVYVGRQGGDKDTFFTVTVTPPDAKLFIGAPNAADSVKSVAIGQYFPRTTSLLIDGERLDTAAVSWTLSSPAGLSTSPGDLSPSDLFYFTTTDDGRSASFTPRSLDSVDIRAVAIVEGQTITSSNKLRLRVTKPDITFDPIPAAGQTFRRDGNTVYDTFQVAQPSALLSVSINLNGAPAAPILPQLQWTSFDTTAIRLTPLPSRLGLPDTTFLTIFKSPLPDTIVLSARVKGTLDSLRFRLTVLPPSLTVSVTAPSSSSAASKSLQLEDTLALRVTSRYGNTPLPPTTPTGSPALGSGSSGSGSGSSGSGSSGSSGSASGAFPASAVLTYTWSSPSAGIDTLALLPIASRSDSLRLTATYAPADSIPLVIRSSAGSLDTFRIKVVPPTLSILPPLPSGQTLTPLPPASASLFSFTATTTPLPGSTQTPRPLSPPLRAKALWTSPNLHKLFIVATDALSDGVPAGSPLPEGVTDGSPLPEGVSFPDGSPLPEAYASGSALVTTRDTGFTSLSLSLAGASLSRPLSIPLPASLSLTLAADTDLLQRPTPSSPLASLQLLPTLLLNSDTLRLETFPDVALVDTFRITWSSLDTVRQNPVAVSPLGLATASAARLTREDTVRIVARIAAFGRSASDTFSLRLRRQTATSLLPLPPGVNYVIRLTPSGLHINGLPPNGSANGSSSISPSGSVSASGSGSISGSPSASGSGSGSGSGSASPFPLLVYTIEGKQIFKCSLPPSVSGIGSASPSGSVSASGSSISASPSGIVSAPIFLPHPFLPHRLYLIHTPQATFKLMTDED